MAKKITSIALAMVLIITCSLGATTALAAESNDNTGQNETIVIDGSVYEFEDAYWNGMPATYINNLTENTRDVVYYDEANGTVYWKGEPMAYIEKVSTTVAEPEDGISPLAAEHWTYKGKSSFKVTWAHKATVFVVAGAISAVVSTVIPGYTALKVVLAIGLKGLKELANAAVGGTVEIEEYYHIYTDGRIQYRWDWTFIAPTTGERYGPFTSYSDADFS